MADTPASTHSRFGADTVYLNGHIVTLDRGNLIASAVAVRSGLFVAAGSDNAVRRHIGSATAVVDLEGRTVVPGFVDGHAHMDREGLKFLLPSMAGARSIADVLTVVRRAAESREAGQWVVTMPIGDHPEFLGAGHTLREKRYPNRWELDSVAPDNPVYIKAPWYYWNNDTPMVSVANSRALGLANISRSTTSPHSGIRIVTDSSGDPTGVFEEVGPIGTVEHTLMSVVPKFDSAARLRALRDSMRRYNAAGTTSVYEGHGVAPEVIEAYQRLSRAGEASVRSHLVVSPSWDARGNRSHRETLDEVVALQTETVDDQMLSIGGIHLEVAASATHLLENARGLDSDWAGFRVDSVLPPDQATLLELMCECVDRGLRVNLIAHDEETLDQHLSALTSLASARAIGDRRFVLQHLSVVRDDQLATLKRLGVHTTIVPGTTMWRHGLRRTQGLDPRRVDEYLPLRSFIEHDVPFAFSTDNVPVEPLKSIWAAVARIDEATKTVVGEGQILTRLEALMAFTVAGAYLTFEEAVKGSIEVGKLADFAVLSRDLLRAPTEELPDIEVVSTVVGGRQVHNVDDEIPDEESHG